MEVVTPTRKSALTCGGGCGGTEGGFWGGDGGVSNNQSREVFICGSGATTAPSTSVGLAEATLFRTKMDSFD